MLLSGEFPPRLDHEKRLYGAPGGHFEFGETFAECASRELREELGLEVPTEDLRYLTTLNVINKAEGFHMCNIFMAARITEEQASTIRNLDVHKCQAWEWIKFDEFMQRSDVFHSFHCLAAQGFTNVR